VSVATLFDFNGVLVDDEDVHKEAFRAVLAPLGVSFTDEAYQARYLGFDDVGAFRAMLADAGRSATDVEVDALVEAKKPVYLARIEHGLVVFPGAADLVRRRAARGPVGIVSGALAHEIRYCLERMGVLDRVAFIVSAEDTTACKPDPEGYHLGLAALARVAPGAPRPVVLEDSVAGIQAAKAAGLRCVAVAHSYPESELWAAGADAVVPRIADLDDATFDGEVRP
jgi:HAD superfamily hydrolase (TIGR01509 family)